MIKKTIKPILLTLFMTVVILSSLHAQQIFHVSPGASKNGKGTLESPFNSIQLAQKAVANINGNMSEDIIVYLHGGTYTISTPIVFDEEDSGTNGHNIIYKAYNDEVPVVSGGVKIADWKKVEGNIYKAEFSSDRKLGRCLSMEKRMHMAGTDIPVDGHGDWGEFEIKGDENWAFGPGTAIDGIKFKSEDIELYDNPIDIELVQFNVWTEKILCARELEQYGDTTVIKLQQPYGAIATSMAWAGKMNYKKSFVIRNAYELLDSPGEFYFNRKTKTIYFYSDGIDMSTAEVIAPSSEGLVHMMGTSVNSKVKNIRFEGITFSHDHWSLLEVGGSHGFAGIQSLGLAVKYVPGGNWHPSEYNSTDVPSGAIEVENAENISFIRNRFEGISSAVAINLVNDVKNSKVEGNFFNDLLGCAVNIGYPQHYKIGDASISINNPDDVKFVPEHLEKVSPEMTVDKEGEGSQGNDLVSGMVSISSPQRFKVGVEGLCEYITVANNYLRNVSLDFRQVEGITSFFVANSTIEHNDIQWTPYGAITCGWWWGNSEIPPSKVAKNNRVQFNKAGNTHQVLDDGGIIYMLGEQPGSVVEGNYVFNGPRCIYPDDGSAYLTIKRNVVDNPSYKWMWLHFWTKRCHDNVARENYVKNNLLMNNGTNNIIEDTYSFRENEFSGEALKIIEYAGIQDEFKDIIPTEEPERIYIHPKEFKERDVFH